VQLNLNRRVSRAQLLEQGFDHIVVATGVVPRRPELAGSGHPKVCSYVDVLRGDVVPGARVAIVGAGGIGFDVAEFLLHDPAVPLPVSVDPWCREWGVDLRAAAPGGLLPPAVAPAPRQLVLLQRKPGKLGAGLGKTSGWVHRAVLQRHGVEMLAGVAYERVDDAGLHIRLDGKPRLLEVDHVVLCAGQERLAELMPSPSAPLEGPRFHCIGGAALAAELDAKRAIREGAELAARL
jgi:2,4-dienoyl-CoA reductase (NADPH2)